MQKKLCKNYCRYYKPDKSEDLACLGFVIAERLMKKGLKLSFKKNAVRPDPAMEETLTINMCIHCPFYEDGCDFAMEYRSNEKGFSKSPPCGGFIFLGHLLEKNIIGIDDIKNIN
jgi:hypothetical protein